jgi:hypothetical protein
MSIGFEERLNLKSWVYQNSSPEFLEDLNRAHGYDLESIANLILEAKIEKIILDADQAKHILMLMQGTNFINLNLGKTGMKFYFSFVDGRTNNILFRKDFGERRKT